MQSYQSGRFDLEYRIVRPEGSIRWIHARSYPVKDKEGRIIRLAGIATDITERKLMEIALQESNDRYRTIIDWSPEPIGVHRAGKIVYLNPAAVKMLGANSYHDLIDKPILDRVHPDFQKIAMGRAKELSDNGGNLPMLEEKFLKLDGTVIDVEVQSIRIIYNGEPAILVAMRDTTEHKLAEEKIKSLLTEKELILREVHHRIKNNMHTMSSLLTLQASTLREPIAIAALEDAGSRLRSMAILYDNLYRTSSYNEMSVLDYFSPLVDEILATLTISKHIFIEKKIDDFRLYTNILQPLGILINELMTNIIKYAFIGKSKGSIKIEIRLKETIVAISVQDDGNGIPESIDFENTSGFGLKLVAMLTKQLKGKILIERENGTKVILEFEK